MAKKIFLEKKNIIAIIVSFFVAYSIVVGYSCQNDAYFVSILKILLFFCIWIGVTVASVLSWHGLSFLSEKNKIKSNISINVESFSLQKKLLYLLIIFIVLFLAYIPYFLIVYPGLFTYDAGSEFVQIWYDEVPVNAMFSIVHSLLLKISCKVGVKLLGNLNAGIAIFTLMHMLICSMVFSYESFLVGKITSNKILMFLSVIYFAFNPTIVLFAGCPHSTVFGSSLAAGVLLSFYDLFISDTKKTKIETIIKAGSFVAMAALACNARQSFTSLLGILLILQLFLKGKRLIRLLFLLGVLILCFLFNAGLASFFKAETSPGTELLSVPAQQLANVYVKEGDNSFDEKEMDTLLNYFSEEHFVWYCPWCTDSIKIGLNSEQFSHNSIPFWRLWIKKGVEYPARYLEAWNYLTYEAWYPFCEPDGYKHNNIVLYGNEGEFKNDYMRIIHESPSEHINRFPKAFELVKRFGTSTDVHKIPVVGQFATIGFQFLFLLYAVGYSIYSKRKTGLIPLAVLLYFIVALFAPIVLIRYHLLMFYMFPIALASLFIRSDCSQDVDI